MARDEALRKAQEQVCSAEPACRILGAHWLPCGRSTAVRLRLLLERSIGWLLSNRRLSCSSIARHASTAHLSFTASHLNHQQEQALRDRQARLAETRRQEAELARKVQEMKEAIQRKIKSMQARA